MRLRHREAERLRGSELASEAGAVTSRMDGMTGGWEVSCEELNVVIAERISAEVQFEGNGAEANERPLAGLPSSVDFW